MYSKTQQTVSEWLEPVGLKCSLGGAGISNNGIGWMHWNFHTGSSNFEWIKLSMWIAQISSRSNFLFVNHNEPFITP